MIPAPLAPEDLDSLEKRFRRLTGVPIDLNLQVIDNARQIIISAIYRGGQIKGVGLFRVYYLDATLVSPNDLFGPMNALIVQNGMVSYTGFPDIQGKRQWVVDIPNTGTESIATIPAAPYKNGGWFYCVGVDVSGKENPFYASTPVSVPREVVTGLLSGIPADVTGQTVVLTHFTSGGEFLDHVDCSYTSPAPFGPFAGVRIFLENTFDAGDLEEVGYFQYNGDGPGGTGTLRFNYERDDGSNPGPVPPAHNVTVYFVSTSALGENNPDITSAPSFVLVGGIA